MRVDFGWCGNGKDGDTDYFASDEFKRRADARAKERFGATSEQEAKRIYENYLKNQEAAKKGK